MGWGDAWKGLTGEAAAEKRAAEERQRREREQADQREREERNRADARVRAEREETERARRAVDRAEREKRETEARLIKEGKENEARLLRERLANEAKLYEENLGTLRTATREKEALAREHQIREEALRKEQERKRAEERDQAAARLDKVNASHTKTLQEKARELLRTKDAANQEKLDMLNKTEAEKRALQQAHLDKLDEQQTRFFEQQRISQDKFASETNSLRVEAATREQRLHEERAKAESDYKRQMQEMEHLSKEEREAMQERHVKLIKSKDRALDQLRRETEERVAVLNKENDEQAARDLATLREIQNERIEREKEMHAHVMEIQEKNRQERGELYDRMIEEKEKAHKMLFLTMAQSQAQMQQYQQMIAAVPRAHASEKETNELTAIKNKLNETSSNIVTLLTDVEVALEDYMGARKKEHAEALEAKATELNDAIKELHRLVTDAIAQVDRCASVAAALRAEWRSLLRNIQGLTSTLTRISTKMLLHAKRKTLTLDTISNLEQEFEKIKGLIYDLPTMTEQGVMGTLEQGQAAIVRQSQAQLGMLHLGGGGGGAAETRAIVEEPVEP